VTFLKDVFFIHTELCGNAGEGKQKVMGGAGEGGVSCMIWNGCRKMRQKDSAHGKVCK